MKQRYEEATTPEHLLENFLKAYTSCDLEGYADLLAEDFVFTFVPCDVTELGLKKDHFDRADELASAARIFSGKPYVRPDGTVVPAITAIVAEGFRQATPWKPAGDPDRPDLLQAVYELRIRFERGEDTTLRVAGEAIFFAGPVPDRRGAPRYRLTGWIDRTRSCAGG